MLLMLSFAFLSDDDNQLLHVSVLEGYEKRRRMLGGMWATTDYEYPIPRSKVTKLIPIPCVMLFFLILLLSIFIYTYI